MKGMLKLVSLAETSATVPVVIVGRGLFVMVIISDDDGQLPLLIVHCKVAELPIASPVTVVVFNRVSVIFAVPLTTVQIPVPMPGLLATKVKVSLLHCEISGPAFETEGKAKLVMTTSSVEMHVPLVMVHRKVAELPAGSPVTVMEDKQGLGTLMTIGPLTTDQQPVPGDGLFAVRVNDPLLHCEISNPAFAGLVVALLVNTTRSIEGAHVPLVIVH